MTFTLRDNCYLKRLEEPHIYDAASDELFLLDDESFRRILALSGGADDTEAAGLLRGERLLQDRPRRDPVFMEGRSGDPSLRYLELQITARCDKVCRHCYLGVPAARDMEPSLFRDILEEFARGQGLKVMVSGGEPALHPRFRELVQVLPRYPIRSVLITHGEWIGEAEARWLGEAFNQVQVSLDGMEPGHDHFRGRGSFARAVDGVGALVKEGVDVSVATMVHSRNLDQFDAMEAMIGEMGVREWDIDIPCPAGRWGRDELDPGLLRAMSGKLSYAFGGGYHGGSSGLACGSHLMTVAPDGTAAKCGFYFDSPAGNTVEGLGVVWGRLHHIPLADLGCDCDQLDECAGGCRFRARVLEGSELAPDPVQCFSRGVK